jgi:hypothetical protein
MTPSLRRLFPTPISRDSRLRYLVKADGVYAHLSAGGKPASTKRKFVKVADIRPPLPRPMGFIVDPEGYVCSFESAIASLPAQPSLDDGIARTLVVLVTDPAALLVDRPRDRTEVLALADGDLVDYLLAWLFHRSQAHGHASLSPPEQVVTLAGLAFHWISWDGLGGLWAHQPDDLAPMAEALATLGLAAHATVLARANGPHPEPQRVAELERAWHAIPDPPVPITAAYLRTHADALRWDEMI